MENLVFDKRTLFRKPETANKIESTHQHFNLTLI